MKYKFKCPMCKKEVIAEESGYLDESHVHCPNCGVIKYL